MSAEAASTMVGSIDFLLHWPKGCQWRIRKLAKRNSLATDLTTIVVAATELRDAVLLAGRGITIWGEVGEELGLRLCGTVWREVEEGWARDWV